MISGFFFWLGLFLGFWFRGTKAAQAIIGWLRPSQAD